MLDLAADAAASPPSLAGAGRLGSAVRGSCRRTRMPRLPGPTSRKRGERACAEGWLCASALPAPTGPARRRFPTDSAPGNSGVRGGPEVLRRLVSVRCRALAPGE